MIKIEKKLIEEFAGGDKEAACQLFALLRRPVFSYFFRLCGNRSAAEDLLQETLLLLHSRIETFNQQCEFMPWAWTIARNKFYEFKRAQTRIVRLVPSDHGLARKSFTDSVEVETDLQSCLAKMSIVVAEAFVFKHFHGMTFARIAQLQQVPLATAKSRVMAALQKIREYFRRGDDRI
jgi:RNA polymerase sigma-70 factor (ECF subfamily)